MQEKKTVRNFFLAILMLKEKMRFSKELENRNFKMDEKTHLDKA